MKKLLLPLLFLPLLFNSCKKAEEKSTPLISGNVDYEFTIKINGYEHKIEGNTFDGDPFGNGGVYSLNNYCASNNNGVFLEIKDISESNFISGEVIRCVILFPNLSLGINNVNISFMGTSHSGYWINIADSLQVSPSSIQSTMGPNLNQYDIPITITDLGSAPNITSTYFHNSTLKGYFNGTVYLRNLDATSPDYYTWNIPMQLELDFECVRVQ
jgi:hypothetical protein